MDKVEALQGLVRIYLHDKVLFERLVAGESKQILAEMPEDLRVPDRPAGGVLTGYAFQDNEPTPHTMTPFLTKSD